MAIRTAFKRISITILFLCACAHAFPQSVSGCYPNAPDVLVCNVEMLAKNIASSGNAQRVGDNIANIMFYTMADATVGIRSLGPGCAFEEYQHLGETARTDKQLGSSPKASGSTSAVEKPGFVQLIGFAVEHGAIQKAVNGTTLTLSTSPYALMALANRKDTAQLYQDYGVLNRLGLATSFDISNQDRAFADVRRKQLTEWSIKARLTGDRSARSKEFQTFWREAIAPTIEKRLQLTSIEATLIGDDAEFGDVMVKLQKPGAPDSLLDQIADYLKAHATESEEKKIRDIKEMILCAMRKLVYDRVKADPSLISGDIRKRIQNVILPALAASQKEVNNARVLLENFITEFNKKPLGTFAYTNHRTGMGSDYSEFKLLYEANIHPLKLIANAEVSLYNTPDRRLNQQRVRDFGVALSLEGTSRNPFAQAADLSQITYSFNGSYERIKENKGLSGRRPDIAVAQFRMEIPFALGLSIPVAFTYSSATELDKKKEARFNVGLNLDTDKLYSLARSIPKH